MTAWILSNGAGEFRQVITDGAHPGDAGEDMTGRTATEMDRPGSLHLETPNLETGTWIDDVAAIKAMLIARIDADREALQKTLITRGTAKAVVYAQKASELANYQILGSAAVAAMTVEQRAAMFPAATAETIVTGETLADVLARIQAGVTASGSEMYRVEAIAQAAKIAVRAAVDKEAAYSAADFEW